MSSVNHPTKQSIVSDRDDELHPPKILGNVVENISDVITNLDTVLLTTIPGNSTNNILSTKLPVAIKSDTETFYEHSSDNKLNPLPEHAPGNAAFKICPNQRPGNVSKISNIQFRKLIEFGLETPNNKGLHRCIEYLSR